uniref:CLP protease regulatory subunit CLPX1 n=1 Tax=Rhizophora mucronata TaxID=61149 RepID=A0A2P2MNR9_RHIMU
MLLMCLITGLTCSLYLLHIKDRENITCQDLGKVCQCSICYCGCNYINSGWICRGRCGVHIIQAACGC